MSTSAFSPLRLLRGALAGSALVLALIFAVRGAEYRTLQQQVNEQRALLQTSQTVANVNNSLIQLLARQAVEGKDEALSTLLARNGVTFQTGPAQADPAQPAGAAS